MKDVQGELDRRNIPLKHVGIKDLRCHTQTAIFSAEGCFKISLRKA